MAYNAKEAEDMIAARDKSGKVLMIGFVMRFTDEGRIAKDFIDKDYLGDIYYARAHYVRRHGSPGGWFANKELSGGGPIIDLGVHVIDFTRYLAGSPKPVSVYAAAFDNIGNRPHLKNGVGWMPKGAKDTDPNTVEDFGTALIRYDNGFVTHLECSYDVHAITRNAKELYGTKGGMDLANGVKIYTETNGFLSDIDVKTSNYKDARDAFDEEMLSFIKCARGEEKCVATAEDGLVVMKILDAIYESARTGHEVAIK
jgi:predicted dehydrogenase